MTAKVMVTAAKVLVISECNIDGLPPILKA